MKFKTLILHILLFTTLAAFSSKKDSLVNLISTNKLPDTIQLSTIRELVYYELLELGNVDNAIMYNELAIKKAQQINSDKWLAKLYSLNGYIKCNHASDFEAAINSYYQALKFYDKYKDDSGALVVYSNLGIAFYNYKQLLDAEKYFLKAEELAAKLNNEEDLALVHTNLGAVYEALNKDSLSAINYEKAKNYYIKIDSELDLATIELNLANLLIKENTVVDKQTRNKAIAVFYKTKEVFKKYEAQNYYLINIISLGGELSMLGKLEEAATLLLEAEKLAIELNDKNLLVIVYEKLADNAKFKEDYKKEAYYLRLLVHCKDELFVEGKSKAIADVKVKYETDKKEAENEILVQEAKIKDAEIKQSNTVKFALLGGMLLISMFSLMLYNRFKTTQKQKVIITMQKQVVEQKNKEILDSIHYAKQIQQALLTSETYIDKTLKRLNKY
jgi:hypothetical protein